jgi:hypothetical protein
MIDINQPESAFPSTFKSMSPEEGQVHRWGMTLRDYFAATAMQGVIAGSGDSDGCVNYSDDKVARLAYDMADAMLKAREA